jgi:hypothetical protein
MFEYVSFFTEAAGQVNYNIPGQNAGSRSANRYLFRHGTVKLIPVPLFTHLVSTGLPFRWDAGFDVVGAFDILEHISEDEAAIAQVYQTIRPGGGMVVTVPQLCFQSCGFS